MKLSANWLKDYVNYDGNAEEVSEDLTMAGLEVEKITKLPVYKDHCLEVEITTNRPDWISHHGVAREIAAVQGKSLCLPSVKHIGKGAAPVGWKTVTEDTEKCPYYSAVLIEGVSSHVTPAFMKKRLEVCGLRSISLLVDITNYVLLETGQPLHAFDADLIEGQQISARRAKKKEKFLAIDGSELELTLDDLVIADTKRAVALAGVMGGKLTEVSEATTNVLLESAFFQPQTVRRTSKRHLLASDSSYRFERKVDPEGVDYARARALDLIVEYAKPKKISAVIKAGKPPKASSKALKLSAKEVEETLGVKIPTVKILKILKNLGLEVKKASTSTLQVSVPSFRPDLTRPVDLIEEIARIYGYDKIEETIPAGVAIHPEVDKRVQLVEDAKRYLSSLGLYETVTFSLISERGLDAMEDANHLVRIVNPMNRELCIMRSSLLTSMLNVIERNLNVGIKDVHLFEVAHVYSQVSKKKNPNERKVIALALHGDWKEKSWLDPSRPANFYDLKGLIQSLVSELGLVKADFQSRPLSQFVEEKSEKVLAGGKEVGWMGEVSAKLLKEWGIEGPVFYAELDVESLCCLGAKQNSIQELPRYPSVERDLSVVVPESVKSEEIIQMIRGAKEPLLKEVELFDLFKGGRVAKGYKSLAYRLRYQSAEKTLVSGDIQSIHEGIASLVTDKFEAKFQS